MKKGRRCRFVQTAKSHVIYSLDIERAPVRLLTLGNDDTKQIVMDAAGDRDLELQKESGDLVKEIKTKLPPLLWKRPNDPDRQPHRWAKLGKTNRLIDAVSK